MTEQKRFVYDEETQKTIKSRIPEEGDFPKVVLIDTISYCNLKCVMCAHKEMKRKPGIMSWELYKQIIDEISENKPDVQIWITLYGEGMMLRDLPDKIAYAVEKGVKNICLNSNGALFKEEFAERLIKSGLQHLLVGIDAVEAKTYEQIRVGGDYARTVNGVLRYNEMLSEFGNLGQDVVVQFVEMDINRGEIEKFVEFWSAHRVKCKIRPMVSWAGKVEASNLVQTDIRLPCYWLMNAINITDTGKVTFCTCDLDCDMPVDDITKRSMKEIWNTTLRKFRDMHRYGHWNELPEMCRKCNDWQSGYATYV